MQPARHTLRSRDAGVPPLNCVLAQYQIWGAALLGARAPRPPRLGCTRKGLKDIELRLVFALRAHLRAGRPRSQ